MDRASLERELSHAAPALCKKDLQYHCLVAFNGDINSTFLIRLLTRKYKLKVLALTVDTGYLPQRYLKDIPYLTAKLGVDHVFVKEHELFRTTLKYEITHGHFSKEEGPAGSLCSKLIPNVVIGFAHRHGIPWVARGNFDMDAPRLFLETRGFILPERTLDTSLFKLYSDKKNVFTQYKAGQNKKDIPLFLHPLNTLAGFNNSKIIQQMHQELEIKEGLFAWENTTSLLTIAGIYFFQKTHGYNPYDKTISDQIRNGVLARDTKGLQGFLEMKPDSPKIKKLLADALKSVKEYKVDMVQMKKDLYMPLLDDTRNLTPEEYLQHHVLDLEDILKEPLLYYPGAGFDFAPFKLFTKNSLVSTVIYCDYAYVNARQAVKKNIHTDLKEYTLLSLKRIEPQVLGCRSWKDLWSSDPQAFKTGNPSDAFGLLAQMRLKSGNKMVNLIYLSTEAIQTYKVLFSQKKLSPTVLVIQDHSGPRNWANFGKEGSKLHVIAKPALPRFLYAAEGPVWSGYERVSEYGENEGSSDQSRALFIYKG